MPNVKPGAWKVSKSASTRRILTTCQSEQQLVPHALYCTARPNKKDVYACFECFSFQKIKGMKPRIGRSAGTLELVSISVFKREILSGAVRPFSDPRRNQWLSCRRTANDRSRPADCSNSVVCWNPIGNAYLTYLIGVCRRLEMGRLRPKGELEDARLRTAIFMHVRKLHTFLYLRDATIAKTNDAARRLRNSPSTFAREM